jgi:hypothetical protein
MLVVVLMPTTIMQLLTLVAVAAALVRLVVMQLQVEDTMVLVMVV